MRSRRLRCHFLWLFLVLPFSLVSSLASGQSAPGVWAWGSDGAGQIGVGRYTSSVEAVPSQAENITAIAARPYYTLILKSDGTVWTWNADFTGLPQTPLPVLGMTSVLQIAASQSHNLALKSDGTVWAWGNNSYGQLGDGTNISRTVPVQVSGLTNVTSISAGGQNSLALKSDGTVWAWGANFYGQLGDGTTTSRSMPAQVLGLTGVRSITCNPFSTSYAIKSDGTVWAWGDNSTGLLGDGTANYSSSIPVKVYGLTNAVAAAAAGFIYDDNFTLWTGHTLVLKSDGTAWAWGDNSAGQFGDGTQTNYRVPVQVSELTGVISLSAYSKSSLALKSDGSVWTWGEFFWNNTLKPVAIAGARGMSTISSANGTSFGLKANGSVWWWGFNRNDYLTQEMPLQYSAPIPTLAETDTLEIDGGKYHSLALKRDGTVWTWGYESLNNRAGEPTQIPNLTDVVAITAGDWHNLALRTDGTVWAWGSNGDGELGDGTSTNRRETPEQVRELTGVTAIAAGYSYSLALKPDGTVWEWGRRYDQQHLLPKQIIGVTNISAISTGGGYSIALRSDGTVWTWGWNSVSPVQTRNLTGIVAIASGSSHNLALRADGTLWAWGYNDYGQMGDGTNSHTDIPVQVFGLTDVVKIACGYYHSLAVKSDGSVWAWGRNNVGQLGDGTFLDRNVPVRVSELTGADALGGGLQHSLAVVWSDRLATRTIVANAEGKAGQTVQLRAALRRYPDTAFLPRRAIKFKVNGVEVGTAITGVGNLARLVLQLEK